MSKNAVFALVLIVVNLAMTAGYFLGKRHGKTEGTHHDAHYEWRILGECDCQVYSDDGELFVKCRASIDPDHGVEKEPL